VSLVVVITKRPVEASFASICNVDHRTSANPTFRRDGLGRTRRISQNPFQRNLNGRPFHSCASSMVTSSFARAVSLRCDQLESHPWRGEGALPVEPHLCSPHRNVHDHARPVGLAHDWNHRAAWPRLPPSLSNSRLAPFRCENQHAAAVRFCGVSFRVQPATT